MHKFKLGSEESSWKRLKSSVGNRVMLRHGGETSSCSVNLPEKNVQSNSGRSRNSPERETIVGKSFGRVLPRDHMEAKHPQRRMVEPIRSCQLSTERKLDENVQ